MRRLMLGFAVWLLVGCGGSAPSTSTPAPPGGGRYDPPRVGDRDGDGNKDDRDYCPDDAEDYDLFEDEDGCPDPDNDRDGVPDRDDPCPNEAEPVGPGPRTGCPSPNPRDRDQDGITDLGDACPDDPEDRDDFEDDDGCPDPDNDQDGILDVDDLCPNHAGRQQSGGCPR